MPTYQQIAPSSHPGRAACRAACSARDGRVAEGFVSKKGGAVFRAPAGSKNQDCHHPRTLVSCCLFGGGWPCCRGVCVKEGGGSFSRPRGFEKPRQATVTTSQTMYSTRLVRRCFSRFLAKLSFFAAVCWKCSLCDSSSRRLRQLVVLGANHHVQPSSTPQHRT